MYSDDKPIESEADVEHRLSKISLFKKDFNIDRDFYIRIIIFLSAHSWRKSPTSYKKYKIKPIERETSLPEKSWFLTNNVNILIRFHETAEFLKNMTNSEGTIQDFYLGYYLYIITESMEDIFIFPKDWKCFYDLRYKWSIRKGDTIACYVMRNRRPVVTDTRETDTRFLTGQDIPSAKATTHVLAVPLLNFAGHTVGVLELYRENEVPYELEFIEYVSVMARFAAETISQNKKRAGYSTIMIHGPKMSEKLNEAMAGDKTLSFYGVCTEHMKKITDAQKVSLFLSRDGQLVEEINTDILEGVNKATLEKELHLAKLTFKSGWILNIVDVFSDGRFDKAEELETGNIIRSVLNITLGRRKHTIGVLQAINKLSGGSSFSPSGEMVSAALANFCTLWYYYSEVVDHAIRLNKTWNMFVNNIYSIISRSISAPVEPLDVKDLTPSPILKNFRFKLPAYNKLPKLILVMMQDIAGEKLFDSHDLCSFINMAKIFATEHYLGIINSAQCVHLLYVILNIYPSLFSHEEQISMMIAGFNAAIIRQYPSLEKLKKRDDPLLYVFKDFIVQRSAVRCCRFLIKSSNLLKNMSEKDRENFTNMVEEDIISTNAGLAAEVFKEIRNIIQNKQFDFINLEHQKLLKALIMFVSVNHCHYTNNITIRQFWIDLYEEIIFVTKGDEVDKPGDPELQRRTLYAFMVRHIEVTVLPYCKTLVTILPRLSEMHDKVVNNCKILSNILNSSLDLADAENEFFDEEHSSCSIANFKEQP